MNPSELKLVENTDEPDAPLDSNGGGGGKTTLEARVAALETHMRYLATKEDVQKIKVWVLGGVILGILTGISLAITLAFAIIRLFIPGTFPEN